MLIVQKFGGTSVGSVERIQNVARRVLATQRQGHKVAVVVSAMSGDFDPTAYKDEYREALMKVIEAKVEGREVAAPAPEPASNLVDLMAALEASVNAAKASRSGEKPVSVREARANDEEVDGLADAQWTIDLDGLVGEQPELQADFDPGRGRART